MKQIKIKLALLVGVSFVLTFSIVLGVFNWVMLHQIKRNASDTINYLESGNEEDIPNQTLYLSDVLYLDENYTAIPVFQISKEREQQEAEIARWCSEHRTFGQLRRAPISGREYYLTAVKDAGEGAIAVLYVDITGEVALIHSINIAILFVMLLMGAGASALGYLTGTQVERSQAAQKTFFENTSHELKTPLTSIRGYAEGMLTGVMDDHKQAAKVILSETEKMTLLVDDILSCARLESGAVQLQKERISLRKLIEDCLLPLEGAIRKRDLHVELKIQRMQIEADPNQLEHALNNILTNAIKYADSKILVQFDGEKLTIWNDGGHLSDEDVKHIFDRFYTGKTGNTGIGLALTKEIATLHGWKLQAEKYDGGIGFIFSFDDG